VLSTLLNAHFPTARHTAATPSCTALYQLMCYSSCPGGLHRRPFEVLFTLEARGRVLGSTSVDVRICACPGRDKRAAENRVLNKMQKGVGPRTEKVSKKEPTSNSPFLYEGCLPVIACSDVNVYPLTVSSCTPHEIGVAFSSFSFILCPSSACPYIYPVQGNPSTRSLLSVCVRVRVCVCGVIVRLSSRVCQW